jgi:hypothetical protein
MLSFGHNFQLSAFVVAPDKTRSQTMFTQLNEMNVCKKKERIRKKKKRKRKDEEKERKIKRIRKKRKRM